MTAITLADLAPCQQWVAWRNEARGDGKPPTKVPYTAQDRRAKADDPSTWLIHEKATALAEIIINGSDGGIGIELGMCGNLWLAGIDLDTCRDPASGQIEPWAQAVLDRFNTYSEVSPSGTGVKAFLLIDPPDIDALRSIMGRQHGRQFKRANGSAHPPAIELHISHRYFAVTWQACADAPAELRLVPLDDLRWLVEEAGPAFAGKAKHEGDSDSARTILDKLSHTAARNRAVNTALRNAATMKGGSRSEGAFGLGANLKRAGWSYEDMKAALLACLATREWAREAQVEGERQFERIWQEARQAEDPRPDPAGEVQIIQGTVRPSTTIPPRQWAYGKFLLFGSAACIGGMDGAGKGMLATAMALAMITGYPLLGEKVWRTGPVAIITYEDDQDEWERRIAAACLHYSENGYNLDYETLIGSFYFLHKPGGRITLAERTKDGLLFPDTARIVHFLKKIDAVKLIIDPFNSAHAMEDGNNNVAIAAVAQEITSIAQQAHVAALLLHHLRKGASGNIDDLMGAVALRANFRSVRILQVADEATATGLGIPATNAWRYLWVAGTKENYAPPPLDRIWFRKASVKLDNPAGIYSEGDEVGAIERWTPPPVFENMDYARMRAVFDALAAKPHGRDRRVKAIPWAGQPLMDLAGRTEEQAKKILNLWLDSETLIDGPPFKTEQRREVKTLIVDPAKVVAILAQHTPAGNQPETANG